MANSKHLECLKKEVEAWNRWRKDNPEEIPDLIEADLSGSKLSEANLRGVNLSGAKLIRANLRGVNLSGAKLNEANFFGANLSEADLWGANLRGSKLSEANLSGSKLGEVDLSGSDLWGTNLRGANLSKANLFEANLLIADLSGADLSGADLSGANITKADLSGADLFEANLSRANLSRAILINAILCRTEISGSMLYGTARDDWDIQGIRCDYLFWDKVGKIRTPKKGNFKQGEFERLYTSLPTIEYFFENGMTPLDLVVMDRVVESIKKVHPEFELQIASVNARDMNQSVELTIKAPEYSEYALEFLTVKYETKIKHLEGERDSLYRLIERKMDQPDKINLIEAQPGSFVANDGSSINIEQYVNHLEKIEKDIKEAPQKKVSETVKRIALDIVGEALKDVAKGQVKEAAKEIVKLGKDIVPFIVDTTAYGFFKGLLG